MSGVVHAIYIDSATQCRTLYSRAKFVTGRSAGSRANAEVTSSMNSTTIEWFATVRALRNIACGEEIVVRFNANDFTIMEAIPTPRYCFCILRCGITSN
jgi:hypothetical protein